jgi:hypothetical protein
MIGAFLFILGFCCVFTGIALAQVDQGAINGTVRDSKGAVIQGALVTLTDTDTNFQLHGKTGANGEYSFSPIKIGHYSVSATAPSFETTTQENITVNIQDVLKIDLALKPGAVTVNVDVTAAPPLLQSENASVGQVVDTDTINTTPLNARNWVFIAQLTAGVAPAFGSSAARGGNTGDFSANGQRTTQNNFILDGVDNNVNVDDEQNGASYNVKPPPDALAEFKIDTSDYSAEFGHSAGAVMNVSIKAGTNKIHGDLWEYVRNTDFDARNYFAPSVPAYHQNQFGATLGLPIWKNKIFYFGDAEALRVSYSASHLATVPSPSERFGDFTEMFQPLATSGGSMDSNGNAGGIFAPNSYGCEPTTAVDTAHSTGITNPNTSARTDTLHGVQPVTLAYPVTGPTCPSGSGFSGGVPTTNVLTAGQPNVLSLGVTGPPGTLLASSAGGMIDPIATALFGDYPTANWNFHTNAPCDSSTPGNCPIYNNYNKNVPQTDDVFQWDQRVDWNVSAADQAFARFSYTNEHKLFAPPLGTIINGGGFLSSGPVDNFGQNFMISETHLFNPKLINEFRFGYNWGYYAAAQSEANVPASVLIPGMGGVPFGNTPEPNGGLPVISFGGTATASSAGGNGDTPSIERQNIYQVLDNVTKVWRNHSFKFGVQFENIRTAFAQSQYPRGLYQFGGTQFEVKKGQSGTGGGIADTFNDDMLKLRLSPGWNTQYYRWYRAGYAQDDWKFNSKLTINLGVRYDFIEPMTNNAGDITNFIPLTQGLNASGNGYGTGAVYASSAVENQGIFTPYYISELASQGVSLDYINSKSVEMGQKTNFAPRIGFAYQLDPKTVLRSGFGSFFASIEIPGGAELTQNFPFEYTAIYYQNYEGAFGCYPSTAVGAANFNNTCPSMGTPDSASNDPNPNQYAATLEYGGQNYITAGGGNLSLNASIPNINRMDYQQKNPYTMTYNLTVERQIGRNMIATIGYVGNVARHTWTGSDFGATDGLALTNPDNSSNNTTSFPGFGGLFSNNSFNGEQEYNSLQAKLEKRLSNGLSFLSTYTWSHAMDSGSNPGIGGGPGSWRNTNIIPIKDEFTNSSYDVRQRVTLNGFYELPFGKGKKWVHDSTMLDYIVGGWQTSLTWVAQTGNPITITAGGNNWQGANGLQAANAIRIGNPFAGGGTPPAGNVDTTVCPTQVKTHQHWYNPCAFTDPLSGDSTAQQGSPQNGPGIPFVSGFQSQVVTGVQTAISYAGGKQNQIYGPGYERVNMSLFKNFHTWRAQYVSFRADAFNLLNHPTFSGGGGNLNNNAGTISSAIGFQANTPDARFFQLSGKYVF